MFLGLFGVADARLLYVRDGCFRPGLGVPSAGVEAEIVAEFCQVYLKEDLSSSYGLMLV